MAIAYKNMQWLNINDDVDYDKLGIFWRSLGDRRPHDHPAYLKMMQLPGQIPTSVCYEHLSGAKILYCFYVLPLNDLPAVKGIEEPAAHILSPYGYGGALYEGPQALKHEVSAEFEDIFSEELLKRGVVSEFVREDLFQEKLVIRNDGTQIKQQPNIVVDLSVGQEERWRLYKHKVRKNVNKARQSGLRVIFDEKGEYIRDFLRVYYDTMKRTNAADSFYIKEHKLKELSDSLRNDNGLVYFHVLDGAEVISTELLLLSSNIIYSFLGGTASSSFDKRPNDLLKHEVIQWGEQNGYKYYVLGGGITPGDGIFRYKESFEPDGIRPFCVRKIVHNELMYKKLIEKRCEYEKSQNENWVLQNDFFPSYLA